MGRMTLVALAVTFAATAVPPPAHAVDACLDSLDAVAGVHYLAADDSVAGPRERTTLCYFEQRNHYTYTFTWACHGDSMDVTFAPHAAIDVTRRQFVRLPKDVVGPAGVAPRLRHYQHDRVAIAQDERPVLLVQWLVAHMPPLHARTKCGATVPGAFADQVFGRAIGARYEAVVLLVRANNDAIAAATKQGTVPLADRAAFFAGLYDRAALVRANFPYLSEAESLLASPRYVNALRPRCDGGF